MAHGLRALEVESAAEDRLTMRAVALLFHDVVPAGRWDSSGFQGADADVYKLECEKFRQHLAAIRPSLSSQPVAGLDLLGSRGPGRPVVLTFDDGGASAALYVADMLDEYGWKAHFLVTAGRIGSTGFLDRPQIRELRRRGHSIGSHSYTHPIRMARCTSSELDDEWRRSVLALNDILGEPVQVASVPGGYYSQRVARRAASAGIKLLFNSEPVTRSRTVDGCLVLGRFTVMRGHTPQRSAALIAGSPAQRVREYLFWNAKKVAKALLGQAWLRARIALMERRARNDSRPGTDSG